MKTEARLENTAGVCLEEYTLGDGVRAFSTLRGDVTGHPYSSFNITHYCGDTPKHVAHNRAALCRELGIADGCLLLPHQTHGDRILAVDDDFLKLPAGERDTAMEGVDALMTDLPRICIGVSTADCVPILIHAPSRHAVAAVHAGWRGTVKNIAAKAVEALCVRYGAVPAEMRAVIGPSISQAAFEVGDEVYEAFREAGFPMEAIARRMPAFHRAPGSQETKWHIDLWAANYLCLEAAGLPMAGIQVSGACTFTSSDRYFSARQLGIRSGRIYNGIMIR